MALTERLVLSGTLEAVINRSYMGPQGHVEFGGRGGTLETVSHLVLRPRGLAASGRRVPSLEIRLEGVLDVAVALQDGSDVLPHCNKVGIIIAAHSANPTRDAGGVSMEEKDLLGRTTWCLAYFDIDMDSGHVAVSDRSVRYIGAGAPECLIAENIWLLRHMATDGMPGEWRSEPRNLGTAVTYLPQAAPEKASDSHVGYADKVDRVQYRAQVAAAVQACCLLDCDGLVIGCAEGICGSELFGHPLMEVGEVWRDVLSMRSAQFRRIAFALGKETPFNRKCTAAIIQDVIGATHCI